MKKISLSLHYPLIGKQFRKGIFPIFWIFLAGMVLLTGGILSETQANDSTEAIPRSRLLRVFPSYRPEECDWALRKFICLRCLKNGYKYAQEIRFSENQAPFRIHGCVNEKEEFFPLPEGRDHPTSF